MGGLSEGSVVYNPIKWMIPFKTETNNGLKTSVWDEYTAFGD